MEFFLIIGKLRAKIIFLIQLFEPEDIWRFANILIKFASFRFVATTEQRRKISASNSNLLNILCKLDFHKNTFESCVIKFEGTKNVKIVWGEGRESSRTNRINKSGGKFWKINIFQLFFQFYIIPSGRLEAMPSACNNTFPIRSTTIASPLLEFIVWCFYDLI